MPKKKRFVTLEDIRVAYDRKTDSVVLTTSDSRIGSKFLLTIKRRSAVDRTLRKLLVDEGVTAHNVAFLPFDVVGSILDGSYREHTVLGEYGYAKQQFAREIIAGAALRGMRVFSILPRDPASVGTSLKAAEEFLADVAASGEKYVVIVDNGASHQEFLYGKDGKNNGKSMLDSSNIAYYHKHRDVLYNIRSSGRVISVVMNDDGFIPRSHAIVFKPATDEFLEEAATAMSVKTSYLSGMFDSMSKYEFITSHRGEWVIGSVAPEVVAVDDEPHSFFDRHDYTDYSDNPPLTNNSGHVTSD